MSKPYYGPLENQHDINLERFLLAGDFVSGVGYGLWSFASKAAFRIALTSHDHLGVQLVLWLSCATYLWQQRQKGRHTTFLLCYIAVLLVAETIYAVAQARTVQLMYVENRRYPGGPWQYFLDTQNEAIDIICYVSLCVIISMCDLLVVSMLKFHCESAVVHRAFSSGDAGSSGQRSTIVSPTSSYSFPSSCCSRRLVRPTSPLPGRPSLPKLQKLTRDLDHIRLNRQSWARSGRSSPRVPASRSTTGSPARSASPTSRSRSG